MSRQDDAIRITNLEILMLKGDKGDPGATYDDTEIRNLINSQNARIDDLADIVASFDGTMILQDFATLELNATSAHNYNVGDYLISNSQFYKVKAPISIGDSFVVNTNIEATTVAEALADFAQSQFNALYGLQAKTTVINKDSGGNTTSIVETSSDAVCTTTFATSGSTTTVTTVIVPTSGAYDYTKTASIVTNANDVTVTESYSMTPKA